MTISMTVTTRPMTAMAITIMTTAMFSSSSQLLPEASPLARRTASRKGSQCIIARMQTRNSPQRARNRTNSSTAGCALFFMHAPSFLEAATLKTPTSTKTRRNVDDDDDIDDSDDDDNDDNAPTITITVLFSSSFEPLPEPRPPARRATSREGCLSIMTSAPWVGFQ